MVSSAPRVLTLVPRAVAEDPPTVSGEDVRVSTLAPDEPVAPQLPDLDEARVEVVVLHLGVEVAGHGDWIGQVAAAVAPRPLIVATRGPVEPGEVEQAVRAGAADLVAADDPVVLGRALVREAVRAQETFDRVGRYEDLLHRLEEGAVAADTALGLLRDTVTDLASTFGAYVVAEVPTERLPGSTLPTSVSAGEDLPPAEEVVVPFGGMLGAGMLRVRLPVGTVLGEGARHLLDHAATILADALVRFEDRAEVTDRAGRLHALYRLVGELMAVTDPQVAGSVTADRVREGLRLPGPVAVEVVLDEVRAWSGHRGDHPAELRRRIVVDGHVRGRITANAGHGHRFRDDEEGRLLSSVADLLAGWLQRQESEARRIAMFEHQLEAVAFVDDDARIVQGNPALADLLGVTQEHLAGLDLRELYAPSEDTIAPFGQVWDQLRDLGRLQGEYEAQLPDGRRSRVAVRAVADVLPGLHLLGAHEVTERHRMELALRQSEARFRLLAEYSAEGIFVQRLRPTIGFEYLNPTMGRMIGYPIEDLYADPELLRSGIGDDDRARMWASLGPGGVEHGDVEIDFAHRDGQVRRLRLRGTAIPDETGQIAVIHAVATDITQQHREQEALRQAVEQQRQLNELKTGFVQAVSHELRTPLTSIVGFVELLLARELGPEDRQRYLRRVQAGAARLGRLVDDVLDLDRLDRPDAGLADDLVDLAELARRVLDETTAVEHQLHLDAEPATTVADDALLERVVDNLVRNALKHTPAGTNVWVRTRAPARIIVEDDGPGVPTELHERIFEPFQQGPAPQATHDPGTGIGLSLVQRIVRLHEGEIVLTDRPGGGARFVITLSAERS